MEIFMSSSVYLILWTSFSFFLSVLRNHFGGWNNHTFSSEEFSSWLVYLSMLFSFPQFSPDFFCLFSFSLGFIACSDTTLLPLLDKTQVLLIMKQLSLFSCFPLPVFSCPWRKDLSYSCCVRAYSQEYKYFCDYKQGKIIFVFTWIWL